MNDRFIPLPPIRCLANIFMVFAALAGPGWGDPAAPVTKHGIDTVLARMRSATATKIGYRETRYLELFSEPVQVTGNLYAQSPDLLINEQIQPDRQLSAIQGRRYYYFNADSGLRRSQEQLESDPMHVRFGAFQALMNGDRALMDRLYHTSFYTEPGHWYMILLDRNPAGSAVRITISGPAGESATRIEIHQADGDRSVFELFGKAGGERVDSEILALKTELQGQSGPAD